MIRWVTEGGHVWYEGPYKLWWADVVLQMVGGNGMTANEYGERALRGRLVILP